MDDDAVLAGVLREFYRSQEEDTYFSGYFAFEEFPKGGASLCIDGTIDLNVEQIEALRRLVGRARTAANT